MGAGYYILIWDGFSQGLVRINPRLLVSGVDIYGKPQNWWGSPHKERRDVIDQAIKDHQLPWLDDCPPPENWKGGPGGPRPFGRWEVIPTGTEDPWSLSALDGFELEDQAEILEGMVSAKLLHKALELAIKSTPCLVVLDQGEDYQVPCSLYQDHEGQHISNSGGLFSWTEGV